MSIQLSKYFTFIFLALASHTAFAQFYNGTQTDFGKNRVQYDDFEWQFYRFDKFETYFYTGGKDLAQHTARYANYKIPQMEKYLDFYNDERLQFIIYNKQSHFRQSNIGLASNENYNIGGVTNIVGSKVFIYFEGDYARFNQQIDAGIYKVLIYQMIFGGNWREVLRNSALLHLPDWYISGLISYLSDADNPYINTRIKDGILNEDFKRFNGLDNEEAQIAGHAMWEYIAKTYGKNVISNILYMTRMSRNIDDGFLYVLGISFEDLYQDWLKHYKGSYKNEASKPGLDLSEKSEIKVRKDRKYQNLKLDPKAKYLAYNSNKLGQYKIYIYDIEKDKRKKIFKADHQLVRIQDYSYPKINWHPSGRLLSFITEEKGELLLYTYNLESEELNAKPIFKMEKVLDYSYAPDGKSIVFSGVNKGKSDLYLYNTLGNTQKNITDDFYDDLQPAFSDDGNSIIFVSSRNNDSLGRSGELPHEFSDKDLFKLDLRDPNYKITSVTNTDEVNEFNPIPVEGKIYYQTNKDGKLFRNSAVFDSSISRIDTTIHYDYYYNRQELGSSERNSLELNSAGYRSEKSTQLSYLDGRYYLGIGPLNGEANVLEKVPGKNNSSTKPISPKAKTDFRYFQNFKKPVLEKELNISNYQFSTEVQKDKQETIKSVPGADLKEIEDIEFPTQRLYRLNFRPDNSIIQLNNSFINGQYQIFNGGPFTNPGLGVNSKIGIVDLMEDHRVYGGFRISGDITEYSLNYQNLKRRLDKEYSISRRKERSADTFVPYDIKTILGTVSFSWPFNEVASLRASFTGRNDKIIPLASDRFALEIPIINEYWATAKAAYVFDNTQEVAVNIRYGTRYKIFAEQYQLAYSENENTNSSDLSVVGFDFRHYQKVHKEIILVSRVAGSKSFGSNPLIYYLGGVDEWWKSDLFDENTPIDFTQNYGFQALAANMRGFLQNVRNGSSFTVMNNELRIPLFAYLINRPIQSDFVRNFQLVGFGDIGTAWVGDSPFAKDNPFNNEVKQTGPITITYENINDPLVGAFGAGLRTTLLGYFVRADWGWGVENGVVSDEPLFMFSLSLDI